MEKELSSSGTTTDKQSIEVSVVLPAYNEEQTIEKAVSGTTETLTSVVPAGGYEVIVTEDGCDDRTPELVARMTDEDDRIRHIHHESRLGLGRALEKAFAAARGDTIVYFDTDMATNLRHLEELIRSVHSGEYDIAIGSRLIEGHEADRPFTRDVLSQGFNLLVRVVLGSSVRDHQCGFKAFDRQAIESLSPEVQSTRWFWDAEVLVRAQHAGFSIKEFPVEWDTKADSKVNLLQASFSMAYQLVRLWWQLSVAQKITSDEGQR